MSDTHKLIYAIIKFLKAQLSSGGLPGECAEGVEVGIQCLETAYNVNASDTSLDVPTGLLEIFQKHLFEDNAQIEVTAEDKERAAVLKTEGNFHMNAQNFPEAIACYTKAIQLDPKNAVYYCNRAAASNKLNKYESAIQDCNTALKYDPTYSKAYGRLGLAYTSMNRHQDAISSYKKAIELDPENESYKANLKLAEEALASAPSVSLPFQNVDLAMIFTNPNLLSMASQMLANPSMQSMMTNILSGNVTQDGAGLDVLLQASQQLAQQMENENPALVEELRRHMGGDMNNEGGGGDASNPQNKPQGPNP